MNTQNSLFAAPSFAWQAGRNLSKAYLLLQTINLATLCPLKPTMNARTPAPDILQTPMNLDGLFEACEQLQKAGQPTQALALYASWLATSQDDNRHMAWFNYGAALQAAGQPMEAIKAYVECLGLKPYFPAAVRASISSGTAVL